MRGCLVPTASVRRLRICGEAVCVAICITPYKDNPVHQCEAGQVGVHCSLSDVLGTQQLEWQIISESGSRIDQDMPTSHVVNNQPFDNPNAMAVPMHKIGVFILLGVPMKLCMQFVKQDVAQLSIVI